MQVREKVEKSQNIAKHRKTVFFPMFCGSGGSKNRLAKAAGVEPSGQMRDEKLHAAVARSTFQSPNVSYHNAGPLLEVEMLKKRTRLWCEAHFQVKKVQKSEGRRPLLEVELKKCILLRREPHFQAKMCKTHQVWSTFGSSDVEKVQAVVARSMREACAKQISKSKV